MVGGLRFSELTKDEIRKAFDGRCAGCLVRYRESLDCAHIYSASAGNFVRNNRYIDPNFVSSALNGVLACGMCHDIIDNKIKNVDAAYIMGRALELRVRDAMIRAGFGDQAPYGVLLYLNCAYFVVPVLERLSRTRAFHINDHDDAIEAVDELIEFEKNIKALIYGLQTGLSYTDTHIQLFPNTEKDFMCGRLNWLMGIHNLAMGRREAAFAIRSLDYQPVERNIDDLVYNIDSCIYPLAYYFNKVGHFLKGLDGGCQLALRTNEYSRPLTYLHDVCIDMDLFNPHESNQADLCEPKPTIY